MRVAGLSLCLGIVGIVFYYSTLFELLTRVLRREGSSHGVFVPLLSLYFLWRKRSHLREIEPNYEIIPGLVLAAGGLLLFLLVRAHDYFFWESFSFIVVLAGFVTCFFGKKIFKEILFPIFFLICMIPIPEHLYYAISVWVRQAAMEIFIHALAITNVPFFREGIFLHLPDTVLRVGLDCSGMRYLLSYFVFGIAYAYLYRSRLRERILLVCLTIPISLLASALRLTVITLLAYYIGPHMAEHWPHILTSWFIFLSVLGFFVALDQGILIRRVRGA